MECGLHTVDFISRTVDFISILIRNYNTNGTVSYNIVLKSIKKTLIFIDFRTLLYEMRVFSYRMIRFWDRFSSNWLHRYSVHIPSPDPARCRVLHFLPVCIRSQKLRHIVAFVFIWSLSNTIFSIWVFCFVCFRFWNVLLFYLILLFQCVICSLDLIYHIFSHYTKLVGTYELWNQQFLFALQWRYINSRN